MLGQLFYVIIWCKENSEEHEEVREMLKWICIPFDPQAQLQSIP